VKLDYEESNMYAYNSEKNASKKSSMM